VLWGVHTTQAAESKEREQAERMRARAFTHIRPTPIPGGPPIPSRWVWGA